jgi:hypothetical protein
MAMRKEFQLENRREFFANGARAAAMAAALTGGGIRAGEAHPSGLALRQSPAQAPTDPSLIHYEEVGRFRSERPEPRRFSIGPDQLLYLCAGHYVTALTREGESRLEIAMPGPARCVAVAEDGTLYIGLRERIEVFDRIGRRLARWESPGNRSWFTGIALAGEAVFGCDAGQRAVLRYDRSGTILGRLGVREPELGRGGLSVPSPFLSAAVGPDGLVYVNNFGRHRIEAYTVEGDLVSSWGQASFAMDGFCGCCNPIGFALLPDGRFVTCEKGIPRVKIYSAAGEFESVVAGPEAFRENAQACSSPNDCLHGGLDVAVDSAGQIVILDLVTGEIRRMRRRTDSTG